MALSSIEVKRLAEKQIKHPKIDVIHRFGFDDRLLILKEIKRIKIYNKYKMLIDQLFPIKNANSQ